MRDQMTDGTVLKERAWWQKPGLGIQFQIEARPGLRWNRNYDKFSASIKDEHGRLKFNGPFCKIADWVNFAKNEARVDYHQMEIKWHDGICYWDTKWTDWKTPVDYGKQFAEESRRANIPFTYYYSSIFDHNPKFDAIQPFRSQTPSHIAVYPPRVFARTFDFIMAAISWLGFKLQALRVRIKNVEKKGKFFDGINFSSWKLDARQYEIYMIRQIREIIEKMHPDGMWMDWYELSRERTSSIVMDFMRSYYPDVVLSFNNSLGWELKWAHYLSREFHNLPGAWTQANKYRNNRVPWELIGPASLAWDRMESRADPYEIIRMAAIILANGGKVIYGMPARMDGSLFPETSKQMAALGKWYDKRRQLFRDAIPKHYKGQRVPGVKVNDPSVNAICSQKGQEFLLHLINMHRRPSSLQIHLDSRYWPHVESVVLVPDNEVLKFNLTDRGYVLNVSGTQVDHVDTILAIK